MNPNIKPILLSTLFFSGILLFSKRSSAQEQIPYINSGEVIQEAVKKYDDGKYKEALKLFRSVPEGDTSYMVALSEEVLTHLADSNYAEAKRIALNALRDPENENRRQFTLLLGHAYDYMGQPDSAITCYKSLLKLNPYDHQPWYEMGATYVREKKYDAAMDCFRHSMTLNPYHFRSHYMVGYILGLQGRLSEAYLALSTSLFTTNDPATGSAVIRLLANIAQQNDDMANAYRNRKNGSTPPAWEEIDEIISSKLPLSKDYKFKSDLAGDEVINDLHAIMEKVRYIPQDTSLVMQYYVPLYNKIFDEDQFDAMMLYMFSGYKIDKVEALVKRNKSDVKQGREIVTGYLDNIAATGVVDYTLRKKAKVQYASIPSSSLFLVGPIKSTDPLEFNAGNLTLYKEGVISARGNYDAEGKKDGLWTFYYANGRIRSTENYKHGERVGLSAYYGKKGTLNNEYTFDASGKQTEEKEYTGDGVLSVVTTVNGDDQKVVSYHANGQKEYTIVITGKKVKDGHYQYFYDDGKLSKDFDMADGERNGAYKAYYRNGQLSEESTYHNGKREGKYASYFKNGKLHYNAIYKNDKLEGPYEEWNDRGKPESKGAYRHSEKDGVDSLYDYNGRAYAYITYEADVPVAYEFRDETGKVAATSRKQQSYTTYYPSGNKKSEIPYQNGKISGTVQLYFPNGNLRRKAVYKEGKQEGETIDYFHAGGISHRINYTADARDGYYQGYHENGKLQGEGWMKNDVKQGLWRFYSVAGKLLSECFYVNDQLNGPSYSFFANGKKDYADIYSNGMIIGVAEYDTLGNERRREYYPQGNGNYAMTFLNGKPRYKASLKNGNYDGLLTRYMPDGTVVEKVTLVNGARDGKDETYSSLGKPFITSNFKYGEKQGMTTYHDYAGTITAEENYTDNEQEGSEKVWEDGVLRLTYNFHHDNIDGKKTFYGDGSKEVCVLYFEDDNLVAYTATGTDGSMGALTTVKNGTCSIAAYYSNGKKALETGYKLGMLNGTQTIYYNNGQVASERTYAYSRLNGPMRRWFPDGKPSYEANYQDNEFTGKEVVYDKAGKPVSTVSYLEGGLRHGAGQFVHPDNQKTINIQYYYGLPVSVN